MVGEFIRKRKNDRIGLIVFGQAAYPVTPFTLDHDADLKILGQTDAGMAGPQTMIGDAIGLAIKEFQQSEAKQRVLILLTDGKANVPLHEGCDAWRETLDQAQLLASHAIPTLVLDTEIGFVRLGRARALATALNAEVLPLDGLDSHSLSLTIRSRQQGWGSKPVRDARTRP